MSRYTDEERAAIIEATRANIKKKRELPDQALAADVGEDALEHWRRSMPQPERPGRGSAAPPRKAAPAPTTTAPEVQTMDKETENRWNEWLDARVAAAIAAERAHWEKQLHDVHIGMIELMGEVLEKSLSGTERLIENGVRQSVKTAETMLGEFEARVRRMLSENSDRVFDLPSRCDPDRVN
jgi:hypothetical protein